MEFVRAFDKLDMIVKFLLTLILGFLVPGIYRILKGRVLTGLLYIITGGFFGIGWVIDLITIALYNKYKYLV